MMQNPKLLLADEPISSLDPTSTGIVLDHIKSLTQARGLTSIINLHQVEFAKAYAKNLLAIDVNIDTTEMLDRAWELFATYFTKVEVAIKKEIVEQYWKGA